MDTKKKIVYFTKHKIFRIHSVLDTTQNVSEILLSGRERSEKVKPGNNPLSVCSFF